MSFFISLEIIFVSYGKTKMEFVLQAQDGDLSDT